MKKIILALVALFLLAACQKPYQTTIELGVNNEEIELVSFEEGHCFITVFSNGSWTIAIKPSVDWASLSASSGSGIGYVRLDYGENFETQERSATIIVEGQGKTCEIKVTQPAAV